MFQKISQGSSQYASFKIGVGIIIVVLVLVGNFFFSSRYLNELSASEDDLYQKLKKTEDMRTLQGIKPETTVKLFLHSIKEEDHNTIPLFYVNGDGTINTSFGPEKTNPTMLKEYLEKFKGIDDSVSVFQESDKENRGGFIEFKDDSTISLEYKDNIWYIDGIWTQ